MACFLGRNVDFIDRAVDPNAWAVADANGFLRDVRERLFDHGLRDPIFSVHLLKTGLAVEQVGTRIGIMPPSLACRFEQIS